MARTPSQRGTFGNWLKRKREERYPRQADALADIRRLTGVTIAPSEFAQWEAGSRVPRDTNPKVQTLFEFFGGRPEQEPEREALDTTAALIAAIDRQTAAIDRQTAAMKELLGQFVSGLPTAAERAASRAAVEEVARALGLEVVLPIAPPPPSPDPDDPPASTRSDPDPTASRA